MTPRERGRRAAALGHLGAVVLGAGWLLLLNPEEHGREVSLSRWKKVDEYETPYLCELGRRENVVSWAKEENRTEGEAALRFRCVRAEEVEGR